MKPFKQRLAQKELPRQGIIVLLVLAGGVQLLVGWYTWGDKEGAAESSLLGGVLMFFLAVTLSFDGRSSRLALALRAITVLLAVAVIVSGARMFLSTR